MNDKTALVILPLPGEELKVVEVPVEELPGGIEVDARPDDDGETVADGGGVYLVVQRELIPLLDEGLREALEEMEVTRERVWFLHYSAADRDVAARVLARAREVAADGSLSAYQRRHGRETVERTEHWGRKSAAQVQ